MSDARRIGPFAVGDVLAQGQDSTLYHAIRSGLSRTDQPVCIRVALDPLDPVSSSAIRTEYEVLRAMDNPRIPKAYGHYADEAAFAMAHHHGASLSDVIRARDEGRVQIGTGTAIDLVIEVAHALRHANSILNLAGGRIVHGHLSPDRVQLTPDGNVVVIGFGASPHGLSPAYMAPETARGEPPCPASDQWSLGAMLIELILGEQLYTGVGDEHAAAQEGDIQHWRMAVIHAHPALEEVLSTMLAINPEHRFSRGHELLKALLAAGRRVGGTVSRRSLTNSVLAHAKQREIREMRQPPTHAQPPQPRQVEPAIPEDLGLDQDIDEPTEWLSPAVPIAIQKAASVPSPFNVEPNAPPAPDPAPRLLPSEFAGMALGSLMMLLGITYVFWVL